MSKAIYNAPHQFTISDFSLGWDIVSSPTALDIRSLQECKNVNLAPNKGLEVRKGIQKLFPTSNSPGNTVREVFEYKAPDGYTYTYALIGNYLRRWNPYSSSWSGLTHYSLAAANRLPHIIHRGFVLLSPWPANDPLKIYIGHFVKVGIRSPGNTPPVGTSGTGNFKGKYRYVYCYRRTADIFPPQATSNPSPISAEVNCGEGVQYATINVGISGDPQVNRIVIYRTYDYSASGIPPSNSEYYFVAEINNATQRYYDNKPDSELGEPIELDNDTPPESKFVTVYKDRVFFAHAPDEPDGRYLVVYSKMGSVDAYPKANYEYFGLGDGEEITGITSLPDYLIVFKRNKMYIIQGDFEEKKIVASTLGIGCIAPYAILKLEDKIVFLSEEGWMAFDGINLYRLSAKIDKKLIEEGYINYAQANSYSAAYLPEKKQFRYLCSHPTLTKKVFCGQFLVPLLFIDKGIPEQTSENLVGWTYHQYDSHNITCLGQYTDSNGITRIMAGASDGYIYVLDSGPDDEGNPISFEITSGWFTLGLPENIVHTIRRTYITYTTDAEQELNFDLGINFTPTVLSKTFYGTDVSYCGLCYCGSVYCSIEGGITDFINLSGTGSWFRYKIHGNIQHSFVLNSITFQSRIHGTR